MAVAKSPGAVSIAPADGAGYLRRGGDQVYYRMHRPDGPARGAVLLAGPWGSERAYAYATWTRWARTLCAAGFQAAQFDYRGMGESSGDCASLSLADWVDDACACLELLQGEARGAPVFLHGLRFGALVAEQLMKRGNGDALLLWDAPATPLDAVRDVLRYRVAEDAVREEGGDPRMGSVDELTAALRAGEDVVTEGHCVSARLWRDMESIARMTEHAGKPIHVIRFRTRRADAGGTSDGSASTVSIPSPPFWRPGRRLVPDLGELFERSLAWVERIADEGRP